jgi:putative chitinase
MMYPITHEQIAAILGAYSYDLPFLPFFAQYLDDFDTPQKMGMFIAQVGVESGNFRYTAELASGNEYEGNLGLGNVQVGDGEKFKGRGLIQVTGRANYNACSRSLFGDNRLIVRPQILEQPQYAIASAAWFWNARNLNDVCAEPEDYVHPGPHQYSKIQYVTLEINGPGLNNFNQRNSNYQQARRVLNF